jgi:hypothetical protein
VEFAPTSMGRGGADELVANIIKGSPVAVQVAGARAIEPAVIAATRTASSSSGSITATASSTWKPTA